MERACSRSSQYGIFSGDDLKPDVMKKPVIVEGEGEKIELSDDEIEVLALGPKFCLLNNLDEEQFAADIEECMMKVKWDMRNDDENDDKGDEDIALQVLLGKTECEKIDDEKDEERKIIEAESRATFNWEEKTFNFSKKRATDVKNNSRVFFPRKPRSLEEESVMETLRVELTAMFREYKKQKCDDKGRQEMNIPKNLIKGL